VIEIGRRLAEAKVDAGHGNWLPWLDREFGWSDETARKFMRCHDFALEHKFQQNWDLPVSALYALALPETPAEARDQILDLAANGEHLTHAQVKPAPRGLASLAHARLRQSQLDSGPVTGTHPGARGAPWCGSALVLSLVIIFLGASLRLLEVQAVTDQ
jgi:hypothetical protein